ncbi:ABC transporter ATP-binding protein [Sphingomonas jatrophae]|uniref:Peptide/nickel transport system ATP-binding protein/oligopeptide transport system ATP-binding protein n=1 Tax=Sphingomonas jatrophae TaxID=1166337 RepID=A0A1I6KAL1_9SPHN|nr:ABC transporter ATP-binding protein [Sphingomonas jatrophae]SFR88249.1 peptide/nickel transport system ATP-binding protein/oligopeptide transport system ATP-binding protein [Sphingomonas jatrophae]
MSRLLDVAGLTVDFRGQRQGWVKAPPVRALSDVALHVDSGEIVGIVGESGSGKTTLGRAILGLIRPTEGSIHFEGTPLVGAPPKQMRAVRRRLQAVFQDPTSSLNPSMTVGAAIAEALALHGIGTREERPARVAALLERVGLPASAAARYPRMLSGGQRQRVGIARALAVEPALIVADEAVSALDVSVQAGIVNLLSDLRDELGLAMLFVSHDLSLVGYFCDRVVVLYLGRVMESGPVDAIFAAPRHPYTRALIDAAPAIDPAQRSTATAPLRGDPPSPMAPPSGCVFRTRCPHAIARCAEVVPPLEGPAEGHRAACIRQDELTSANHQEFVPS